MEFTAVNREEGVAQGETRDDIGAPGDGGELYIGLDRLVDVIKGFGRQRRAGREDGPKLREVMLPRRMEAPEVRLPTWA